MKITWLGHSSFLVETRDGTRIVTDPFESGSYDGAIAYPAIHERADVVTVSHDHADHNAVDVVEGDPEVVRGADDHSVKGIAIHGVPTFHDANKGHDRGRNTVFVMNIDGLRVAHLGDLGHVLSSQEAAAIGPVDVLMLPIGGYYTIGPEDAKAVAESLSAKIILPMHYKTDVLGFPIQPVDDFLRLMDRVQRVEGPTIEIGEKDVQGPSKVVVLGYK
jgi:L-ascorbate metabolism protein UlaG (beta-lactamase superfamily)